MLSSYLLEHYIFAGIKNFLLVNHNSEMVNYDILKQHNINCHIIHNTCSPNLKDMYNENLFQTRSLFPNVKFILLTECDLLCGTDKLLKFCYENMDNETLC